MVITASAVMDVLATHGDRSGTSASNRITGFVPVRQIRYRGGQGGVGKDRSDGESPSHRT
jgi:hypothetical protein